MVVGATRSSPSVRWLSPVAESTWLGLGLRFGSGFGSGFGFGFGFRFRLGLAVER